MGGFVCFFFAFERLQVCKRYLWAIPEPLVPPRKGHGFVPSAARWPQDELFLPARLPVGRVAAWWHCRRPLLLLQCSGPVSVYTQGLNLGLDLILALVLSLVLIPKVFVLSRSQHPWCLCWSCSCLDCDAPALGCVFVKVISSTSLASASASVCLSLQTYPSSYLNPVT